MAIVNVKNATVARTFYNGLGASIKETFQKRDGSEGASYYTAFFDKPHGLSEGDTGNFSGLLSVRAREYENKDGDTVTTADAILNSARFEPTDGGSDSDAPF